MDSQECLVSSLNEQTEANLHRLHPGAGRRLCGGEALLRSLFRNPVTLSDRIVKLYKGDVPRFVDSLPQSWSNQ